MYQPPVAQMLLAMRCAGGVVDDAEAILTEAARFAAERIAPLNKVGDQHPARLLNGSVVTPPGWKEVYREWREGGWNSLTGPVEHGGQKLPMVMAAACAEMWNASSLAFALCPLLTTGAIEAINAHASEELKLRYLPKMISGEWTGTMNLTEPQSGSDLSQLRCRATRNNDDTYRISGNKIYITYGEHDWSSNIVHLVLARLEDAPPGTKGISLFLVPKFLPDGTRNDVRCHSLENKLGIHGSPTCAMIYGDQGGATGWLIGEENRGLNCMFTMMNNARLLVGVQGVALADRAMQAAFAYAAERRQGRGAGGDSVAIVEHPDVKRMLMEMRVKTAAARMLCMATAAAIDAGDHPKASLLTPLAKSYATDIAVEVASTAVQVHGGMGFIEETGVAQYYRDARILPIYEGTNGIQAIDLVTRKLGLEDGRTLADVLKQAETSIATVTDALLVDDMRVLAQDVPLAAASPFLRALAATVAAGYLARGVALEAEAEVVARYFITTELPSMLAAARGAKAGAEQLRVS